MIGFFRRIRKKLADDNKPMKYMRYAIGEIALVVIGILIALSINNWNDKLKVQHVELKLLKTLEKEIAMNIKHFDEILKLHKDSKTMCVSILKQFGNSIHKTDYVILDSLVELATAPITLNPQMGVVKSIITTGDIKHLKNKSIVQFVTMFEDKINDAKDDFNRLIGVWNSQLWPRENLYIRRVNRANKNNEWLEVKLPQKDINSDYDSFFNDIVLENTYMLTLYEQTVIIKKEESLLNQMKSVNELINSEILKSN